MHDERSNAGSTMNETQINFIKRHAKRIKKKHSHIPLMQVQHDLAKYLGFKKWGDLLLASSEQLNKT